MHSAAGEDNIQKYLTAIFDTVIDGIIIINARGIIQTVNPAACRQFGYAPEEMVGRNVSMLMPAPDNDRHDGYINSYLQTGIKKIIGIGREVSALRKDDTIFPIRLSISETEIDGAPYFTGVVHDITEVVGARAELELINRQLEKIVAQRTEEISNTVNKLLLANQRLKEEVDRRMQTERDLEVSLEKANELNQLKSQFVTMASHEFRTPLSTILSSASILNRYHRTDQQDKRDRHISKIKHSVRHMIHILEDILSLGKLEEGKIVNQPADLDLQDMAADLITGLQSECKSGQTIELQAPDGAIQVFWDKNLTTHILSNLLSNAVKYSGEGQRITLLIREESHQVQIDISDSGIGIPADQQKHLFERFFRATNALNIKGTGLGLHIVAQYVEMMQGEISFTSKEGEGSVFSLTIPKNYV